METIKQLIYNHPLFPLLISTFRQCELATQDASWSSLDLFYDNVQRVLQLTQWEHYRSNHDIDQLMIDTIRVLRFHWLELCKVQGLCDTFCEKYVGMLKAKLFEQMQFDEEETSFSLCSSPITTITITNDFSDNEIYENEDQRQLKTRGIFSREATFFMRTWLFQHLHHPYPSEEEKRSLAKATNLNIVQVNNWFINARRRIIQPIIDHC